ncbi:MAG TPA: YggT family protein [Polyangiales bacterium]|nr:YggT family protein [Polyangiales bacterium]
MFQILTVLQIIIVADALLSWFMPPEQFPRSLTTRITVPLYAPIRAVLNPQVTGGFDFSPILVLLLVNYMKSMLTHAL